MQITDQYYHIFNRGAHKADIFHEKSDYEHFQFLIYKCNNANTRRVDLREISRLEKYALERDQLVEVFAYCLMPNHYHIGTKQLKDAGIPTFMLRLCTSYVMYYNNKYMHSGALFQGQYKSKHLDTDEYLRYILRYIHLNPFNLDDPELMKSVRDEDKPEIIEKCLKYEYSSLKDYNGIYREESKILNKLPQGYPVI